MKYYIFDREGRGFHIIKASSVDRAREALCHGSPWEYRLFITCETLEAANEVVFMERVKREAAARLR